MRYGYVKRAFDERADRALDLVVAIPALLLAAPIIAAAAIAIRVDSRGPVLYHGVRVGRDGSLFEIHKLRTMRLDAESTGPGVTAGRDPRVTRVGRVLRRIKLDGPPQPVNVLVGGMGLGGP